MSDVAFNPFQPIYEYLSRMENHMLEMRAEIDQLRKEKGDREKDDQGIAMAIRLTGYTRSTIYKLVNLREIPHSKHRGKLRFDENELREWRKGRPRDTAEQAKKRA